MNIKLRFLKIFMQIRQFIYINMLSIMQFKDGFADAILDLEYFILEKQIIKIIRY